MLLGVRSLYFKTKQSANLHDDVFWAEPALGTATVWICIRTGARWWKRTPLGFAIVPQEAAWLPYYPPEAAPFAHCPSAARFLAH